MSDNMIKNTFVRAIYINFVQFKEQCLEIELEEE